MLDNNHNNSPCLFSEQLVSYLYNETNVQEKTKFEAHLKTCSNCANEIAGFSFVRSSVLEWQKEEFSVLKTPEFVFPNEKKKVLRETVSALTKEQSWLTQLRKLFSLSPAWATATSAMAVLAVCVGLILVVLNFSRNDEMAGNNSGNIRIAAVSPTMEMKAEEIKETGDEKNTAKNSSAKSSQPKDLKAETFPRVISPASVKSSDSNNSVVKVSNVSRNKANVSNGSKVTLSAKSQKLPKFVDVEEDEDNSLRLSDLFEEVDSK